MNKISKSGQGQHSVYSVVIRRPRSVHSWSIFGPKVLAPYDINIARHCHWRGERFLVINMCGERSSRVTVMYIYGIEPRLVVNYAEINWSFFVWFSVDINAFPLALFYLIFTV